MPVSVDLGVSVGHPTLTPGHSHPPRLFGRSVWAPNEEDGRNRFPPPSGATLHCIAEQGAGTLPTVPWHGQVACRRFKLRFWGHPVWLLVPGAP